MGIFESSLIVYIILLLLIIIYIVRISNNKDIIKENMKDPITDKANIKNARKYYAKKKTFKYLLIAAIAILTIFILWDFTDLEVGIIDYFSYDIYKEQEFNRALYLFPIYIFIIRQIIFEVKVGDFLFKYYKVDEPVLEENLLKTLLYKKPQQAKPTTQEKTNENKESK